MEVGGFGATIGSVMRIRYRRVGLRVFDEDIEVAIFVENAGIDQLKFRIVFDRAAFLQPVLHREIPPADTCTDPHVRMGWSGVEVEIILLHIFAVVSPPFRPNSRSLRIGSRPFHSASAKHSAAVGRRFPPARLRPSDRPASGRDHAGNIPRLTVSAVVLAHGPPRALTYVWTPASPWGCVVWRFPEPEFFCSYFCHT